MRMKANEPERSSESEYPDIYISSKQIASTPRQKTGHIKIQFQLFPFLLGYV